MTTGPPSVGAAQQYKAAAAPAGSDLAPGPATVAEGKANGAAGGSMEPALEAASMQQAEQLQQLGAEPSAGPSSSSWAEEEEEEDFEAEAAAQEEREAAEDPDFACSDEEREKRWQRPSPAGERRSRRVRTTDGEEEQTGTQGGASADPSAIDPSVGLSRQRSGEDDDEEEDEEGEGRAAAVGMLSPDPATVKRDYSEEEIVAHTQEIRGMWEMAAVLDFLHLFRHQLRLSRQFGADELERVLVTSKGQDGLLADLHVDLMRGISPKSDVCTANWQIHLANKIKFHWKCPTDGAHCPFKPDKYYEATTYAALLARDRVRALQFLCCIRVDREDVQERVERALRGPTLKELTDLEAAQAAALKAKQPDEAPVLEDADSFRRAPLAIGSDSAAYFYLDSFATTGFRMYREMPLQPALKPEDGAAPGSSEEAEMPPAVSLADAAEAARQLQHAQRQDGEVRETRGRDGRRRKRRRREDPPPLPWQLWGLPEPPAHGSWELVASSQEELKALGRQLAASSAPSDKALARTIEDQLLPVILEQRELDERRFKAVERAQRKLGAASAAVAEAVEAVGGRPRRERRVVSYAFNEYDAMLRSAIKRTQRGEGESEEEEGGRRSRRRRVSPLRTDAATEARLGMRRGRSAAAIREDGVDGNGFLDERALRLAAARARGSRNASTTDLMDLDGDLDEGESEEEGGGQWEQPGTYAQQQQMQAMLAQAAGAQGGAAYAPHQLASLQQLVGQPQYPGAVQPQPLPPGYPQQQAQQFWADGYAAAPPLRAAAASKPGRKAPAARPAPRGSAGADFVYYRDDEEEEEPLPSEGEEEAAGSRDDEYRPGDH